MTEVRYAPGSLRVVVGGRVVVVLGEGATDAATLAIHERLAAGEGFGAVVDALAAGASLGSFPAFAVVVDEGAVWRVIVRGELSAVVTAQSGTETVDGSSASTWSERSIPGATVVTVGDDADSVSLPIADGVILASTVHVSTALVSAADLPPVPPLPVEPVQPHSVAEVGDPVPAAPNVPPPLPLDEGTLIDSIPPSIRGDSLPRQAVSEPPAAPEHAADPASGANDDLEATTVVGRPLRGADAVADPAPEAPVDPSAVAAGDHDGETLSLAEARRLRATGTLPPPVESAGPPATAPRGPIGRLRLSTGQLVLLDRTVIIGRRPRSSRASGAEMPHLIGVDSPQQDISRNHIEVRAEGDSILVTDLQTTNGTTLRRPGAPPARLHPGEATILVPSDVLDLGDGVTVTVEAMP